MLKKKWSRLIVLSSFFSFFTASAYAAIGCDFSFGTPFATFACGSPFPQTGVYTLTNNTPVAMRINYVQIKQNDAFPASSASITANTCGTSLAAHSSCSVTVTLTTAGPFNRILQIGVNSRQVELDSPVITPTIGCNISSTPSTSFTSLCSLGTTSSFATLAGSTITNTGFTQLNGNLGLSPGTSVTGFPPGVVNGTQFIADTTAATAKNDLTTLFNCLGLQPCTVTIGTVDQAGQTITSTGIGAVNVICSASTININGGALTLSGDPTSVFIFKAGSALNVGSGASIVLAPAIGGVQASNVFWQVGSSAVLGTSSIFKGTIAASQSITMNTGAIMTGRALTQVAAVTFDTNSVVLP